MGFFSKRSPAIEGCKERNDVDGLIKALKNGDHDKKLESAKALGDLNDEKAVIPLIVSLRDIYHWSILQGRLDTVSGKRTDSSKSVQAFQDSIADALVQIGEKSVEILLQYLANVYMNHEMVISDVRHFLLLHQQTGVTLQELNNELNNFKDYVYKILIKIGDPSIRPLIQRLRISGAGKEFNVSISMEMFAEKALAGIGRAAMDPLIAALPYASEDLERRSIIQILGDIGNAQIIKHVLPSLDDANPFTRQDALRTLRKVADLSIADSIIKALSDKTAFVREEAIRTLCILKAKDSTTELIKCLEDADDDVRKEAAIAIGELGDQSVADALILALSDKNYSVREEAARSLGKLGGEKASEPLIKMLDDEERRVRESSASALSKLRNELALEILLERFGKNEGRDKYEIGVALDGLRDDSGISLLSQFLKHKSVNVRVGTLRALARIRNLAALSAVKTAINDENDSVRGEAESIFKNWEKLP